MSQLSHEDDDDPDLGSFVQAVDLAQPLLFPQGHLPSLDNVTTFNQLSQTSDLPHSTTSSLSGDFSLGRNVNDDDDVDDDDDDGDASDDEKEDNDTSDDDDDDDSDGDNEPALTFGGASRASRALAGSGSSSISTTSSDDAHDNSDHSGGSRSSSSSSGSNSASGRVKSYAHGSVLDTVRGNATNNSNSCNNSNNNRSSNNNTSGAVAIAVSPVVGLKLAGRSGRNVPSVSVSVSSPVPLSSPLSSGGGFFGQSFGPGGPLRVGSSGRGHGSASAGAGAGGHGGSSSGGTVFGLSSGVEGIENKGGRNKDTLANVVSLLTNMDLQQTRLDHSTDADAANASVTSAASSAVKDVASSATASASADNVVGTKSTTKKKLVCFLYHY